MAISTFEAIRTDGAKSAYCLLYIYNVLRCRFDIVIKDSPFQRDTVTTITQLPAYMTNRIN